MSLHESISFATISVMHLYRQLIVRRIIKGLTLNIVQHQTNSSKSFKETARITSHSRRKDTEKAQFLANILKTSPTTMQQYLTMNSIPFGKNNTKLKNMIQLLTDHGFVEEDILKHPRVFQMSIACIKSRIYEMTEHDLDPELCVITLSASRYNVRLSNMYSDALMLNKYKNHTQLLITKLNCSRENAAKVTRNWFTKSKLSVIEKNIELVQSYGASGPAILERLHVLIIPQVQLKRQLSTLHNNKIYFADMPKRYVSFLQAKEIKFQNILRRIISERTILEKASCLTKHEYFALRLNINEDILISKLKQSHKTLLTIRLEKLKQNLDILLLDCSFASAHVFRNLNLLNYASKTLTDRCIMLRDLNTEVTISVLKLTEDKFQNYINVQKC